MHESESSLPPPTMTKLIRKGALSFGKMKDMGGYVVGDRNFMISTPFKQNHPGRLSERPERWNRTDPSKATPRYTWEPKYVDMWSLFDIASGSNDISEIARYRLSSSKSEIILSLPDVVKYCKVYLGKVLRILSQLTRALPQWTRLFYMARYHQTLPEEANIVRQWSSSSSASE